MSKNKTLRQVVFLSLICLSAILLCFVGVYAAGQFNLKFYGNISPDILCKIEIQKNGTGDFITIFDNKNKNQNNQYTLSPDIALTTNSVADTLKFRLTNYTSGKHIRLSLSDVKIATTSNGNTSTTNYNYDILTPICCDSSVGTTAQIQDWTITKGTTNENTKITFNVMVEVVNKLTVSGNGLASAGSYYYTSNETPTINLVPSVGYQLPETVSSSNVSCTAYTVSNNLTATATLAKITQDATFSCNCEKVFTIYENQATSMLTANASPDANLGFLPNNGEYTVSDDVYTTNANFKEYKYFIEMGQYPQSLVASASSNSVPSGYESTGSSYNQKINGVERSLQMYKDNDNNYYVWSPIKINSNSDNLGSITSANTGYYGMFKLEPIVWIVVGAKNSDNSAKDLDTLYYKNNMLYSDEVYGKPFTGQLELLSAYGLDSTSFMESSSKANYSESIINTLLSGDSNSFYYNNRVLNSTNHLYNLHDNYLLKQSALTTYEADTSNSTHYINGTPSMFVLGFGKTDSLNTTQEENYAYTTYFKSRAGETGDGTTYSVGVTSLSDFAIAHYAENGKHPLTNSNMGQYAVTMGWSSYKYGLSAESITTKTNTNASCAYWLRTASASSSTNAYLINLNGVPVVTNTADSNICLRPFTVLNLSYYYNASGNNTFYGSNYTA